MVKQLVLSLPDRFDYDSCQTAESPERGSEGANRQQASESWRGNLVSKLKRSLRFSEMIFCCGTAAAGGGVRVYRWGVINAFGVTVQ